MRNKPSYALTSVDNALRLVQLLRDQGRLRVTDAARELDVAPSTAHRLLGMLVYRGFAIQDDGRAYVPGAALGAAPVHLDWTRRLRDLALPHLDLLAQRTGETTNVMIRIGTQVRFLATVESTKVLRVGSRAGTVLPARWASGGKALLAELDEARLRSLYRVVPGGTDDASGVDTGALVPGAGPVDAETTDGTGGIDPDDGDTMSRAEFQRFLADLALIRRQGYALNNQHTEESVVACGAVVPGSADGATAALSVSMPSSRYTPAQLPGLVRELRRAAAGVQRELSDP